MRDVDALVAELRKQLEAFDLEVDFHMRTEGERADLWEEIDVPVASVRALLDALESERSRADRLEKALKPFAAFADQIAKERPGWDHDGFTFGGPLKETKLTMGDFRHARTAIGKEDVR